MRDEARRCKARGGERKKFEGREREVGSGCNGGRGSLGGRQCTRKYVIGESGEKVCERE